MVEGWGFLDKPLTLSPKIKTKTKVRFLQDQVTFYLFCVHIFTFSLELFFKISVAFSIDFLLGSNFQDQPLFNSIMVTLSKKLMVTTPLFTQDQEKSL